MQADTRHGLRSYKTRSLRATRRRPQGLGKYPSFVCSLLLHSLSGLGKSPSSALSLRAWYVPFFYTLYPRARHVRHLTCTLFAYESRDLRRNRESDTRQHGSRVSAMQANARLAQLEGDLRALVCFCFAVSMSLCLALSTSRGFPEEISVPVRRLSGHAYPGHADAEARRSVLTALPCATLVTVPQWRREV